VRRIPYCCNLGFLDWKVGFITVGNFNSGIRVLTATFYDEEGRDIITFHFLISIERMRIRHKMKL
jgi:hypothetical protein